MNTNNRYFVLRHGESKANVAKIVLSHLEEGQKSEYSLTPNGEGQVRDSVRRAKADGWLDEKTIIYASPLSRCRRSAEIAKEELGVRNDIVFDDRLRERWFGEWEKTDNSAYQKVWDVDKENPAHTQWSVESAQEVQSRMLQVVSDLEKKYSGKTILLVSHGDPLQILYTGVQKKSASAHRGVPHLQTAEIRALHP